MRKIPVGKGEGRRPPERHRHRWEYIKIEEEDVKLIDVAQNAV
jgi:hypothetical protein